MSSYQLWLLRYQKHYQLCKPMKPCTGLLMKQPLLLELLINRFWRLRYAVKTNNGRSPVHIGHAYC